MGVAFALGFLVVLAIMAGMLFLAVLGLILLIVGLVKRHKYNKMLAGGEIPEKTKNGKGRRRITHKVLIVLGSILLGSQIAIVGGFWALGGIAEYKQQQEEKYSVYNAVANNDYQLLKELLDGGAPADSTGYSLFRGNIVVDNFKDSPLKLAVTLQRTEMVQLLIDYGADPNRKCRDQTPASEAISKGYNDYLEMMLKSGRVNTERFTLGENKEMYYAELAVDERNFEALDLLIMYGTDPDQEYKGMTFGEYAGFAPRPAA